MDITDVLIDCKILGIEPMSSSSIAGAGGLISSNNLSDVDNANTSRTNLDAQRLTIIGSGSPSAVAGGVGDGYFDSTSGSWYVCTVAGAPGTWQSTTSGGDLLAANNLSDVANTTTSRTNLGAQRLTIIGSGSPSAVAGGVGDGYFDSTARIWYVCTVAGAPGTWLSATALSSFTSTNKSVASVSIASGGSGYSFGDIISPSGGTAVIPAKLVVAATGPGGSILAASFIPPNADSGVYSVSPPLSSNPFVTLTGSGSGALINIVMQDSGVVTIDPNNPASINMNTPHGYLQLPSIPPGQEQSVTMNEGGIRYQNTTDSIYLQGQSTLSKILTDQDGVLFSANNLSDVSDLQTSRANLSVPRITSGSGSPSGVVDGAVNDLYVNNTANVLYRCVTAGTASTAVWSIVSAIPVNGTQIVNTTPFQAISNTTYITTLSSPACNIILPVSPVVGDRITVLSYAASGFSITKGTAGILQVDGYAVSTNLNSTAIGDGISLLCVNASGGGQWINTAIFNTLLADSTVKLPRLVANSLATPSNPVVISTVAPSVNQQLTATSATNATWQTPFSYTAISAFRLSPPIVVPAASGLSIAIFTSAPINSDTAYNLLTGVFTVPAGKGGVWLLNYNIRHTSTGAAGNPLYWLDAAIYKNGAYASLEYTTSRMNLANGNIGAAFNSSNILTNLVAGDQITVRYINNGNTSVTINSLNLTIQWISK